MRDERGGKWGGAEEGRGALVLPGWRGEMTRYLGGASETAIVFGDSCHLCGWMVCVVC